MYLSGCKTVLKFRYLTCYRLITKNFHIQSAIYNCNDKKKDYLKENNFNSVHEIKQYINYSKNIHKQYKHLSKQKNKQSLDLSIKDITKLYPNPKSVLNNYYSIVSQELKLNNVYKINYSSENSNVWQCTCTVSWPENQVFTASEKNKRNSSSVVSYKCLQWLHSIGKINNKGYPILYEKTFTKQYENLEICEDTIHEMENIVEEYNKDIKGIVQSNLNEDNIDNFLEYTGKKLQPIINDFNNNPIIRNKQLYSRWQYRQQFREPNLPILQHKNEIIKNLDSQQVFIIQGETGCGKTTQVPQIIMDYYTSKQMAASCNIIVTQPRRISAISIAERVAEERKEEIGDVIGYQVRLEHNLPGYPGSILYCTTGMLRNKIQIYPDLQGLSHVILDEAHERTVDTDVLLVLLKRVMKLNPQLKVIIMSATLNAELFQNYFMCPMIKVPGMLHPVKMHFLDDINKWGINPTNAANNGNSIEDVSVDVPQIASLIQYITLKKPPGAILCFLSGWSMIAELKNMLEKTYLQSVPIKVFPVHSKMSNEEQKMIFNPSPEGIRKIILATNIAETGITVPDVVYVVDCAVQKHFVWNPEKCTSYLMNTLISKSNIDQRKGRAGRLQSGESYHLITKDTYKQLRPFPLPEILRTSLEKVVLDCKSYSADKAEKFFNELLDPPSTSAINEAISDLIKMGALNSDEKLTHLGKRIAIFSEHPTLAKAMVLSKIFCCVDPMLTISAIFSMNSDIFLDTLTNKSEIREIKKMYHPFSDHLAYVWIYKQSQEMYKKVLTDVLKFNVQNRLIPERLKFVKKLRHVIFNSLHESGMTSLYENYDNFSNSLNYYSNVDELVLGVFLGGTDKIFFRKKYNLSPTGIIRTNNELFIAENDSKGFLSTETVNYKRKDWPSSFLTYFRKTHSPERRGMVIRESSVVSPLTVLLFASGKIHISKEVDRNINDVIAEMIGKPNVKIICDQGTLSSVLKFREMLWDVVHYFYVKQTSSPAIADNDFLKVEIFKSKMLKVLVQALNDGALNSINSEKYSDCDDERA